MIKPARFNDASLRRVHDLGNRTSIQTVWMIFVLFLFLQAVIIGFHQACNIEVEINSSINDLDR